MFRASPLTACAPKGHTRRVTHKEPDAVCIYRVDPPDDENNMARNM